MIQVLSGGKENMRYRVLLLCIIGWMALASGQWLKAQSISYGKLTGMISDPEGQALPGVMVEVSSPALISGTRTTTSSVTGSYVFLNLPVGTYTLSASMQGFSTVLRSDIKI